MRSDVLLLSLDTIVEGYIPLLYSSYLHVAQQAASSASYADRNLL